MIEEDLYNKVNWFIKGGDFQGLDRWIMNVSEENCNLSIHLDLLRFTLPSKDKLTNRKYVFRVATMLVGLGNYDDSVLEGLE